MWVTTVFNIDWPSQPGLPVEQQRAGMNAILDRARALNLNAVILQIRPAADALYASTLEPWSKYLTGEQGRDPGYDPLAEWVEGAHRRGLELHAWFNPYRARASAGALAANHISKTHPEVVKAYGTNLLWMDPGEPVATRHTLEVIRDVVRRYDIDGVHLDDHFYPYPVSGLSFPDEPSWQRYLQGGGQLARADWRRQNVNGLVEQIRAAMHAIKPWVKFGISPFGIGRPDLRPPGIGGFSQFDEIYADVELWLARGWMDYLAPQLYWRIDPPAQSFPVLLDYWARQNPKARHLWPGLFTSRINDTPESWTAGEITRQVELVRANPAATGHAHFSLVALMQDRKGVGTALAAGAYQQPALVPATPWLDDTPPPTPALRRVPGAAENVSITGAPGEPAARFAVWKLHGREWRFLVQPASETTIGLAPDPVLGAVDAIAVNAVDRVGNESARAMLWLNPAREPPPSGARLINVSTRANAGSGEATLIVGFVIDGTGSKTLLIRGVGPKLTFYGVPNVVANPALKLYSGQNVIAENDDWASALAPDFATVGAFALDAGSRDAAMKITLSPGAYTIHLVNPGAVAEALVEVYDFSKDAGTRLINLSCRLHIGSGDTVIVGTVLEGGSMPLILRNIGPGLTPYGVTGILPDPKLRLFSGQTMIAENDTWTSTLALHFAAVGAFPLTRGSTDAAHRLTVAPGAYTVHATGTGPAGVALVELYESK